MIDEAVLPVPRVRPIRVLVVEDDADLRHAIRDVFLMSGMVVNTAADGLRAVEHADREPYDVIVCDVRLPGMDGVGVTRSVQALRHAPRVILITAYPQWHVFEAGHSAGAAKILSKPLNLVKLAQEVDAIALRKELS
jgi:DNA-binding response OmpR family regulator